MKNNEIRPPFGVLSSFKNTVAYFACAFPDIRVAEYAAAFDGCCERIEAELERVTDVRSKKAVAYAKEAVFALNSFVESLANGKPLSDTERASLAAAHENIAAWARLRPSVFGRADCSPGEAAVFAASVTVLRGSALNSILSHCEDNIQRLADRRVQIERTKAAMLRAKQDAQARAEKLQAIYDAELSEWEERKKNEKKAEGENKPETNEISGANVSTETNESNCANVSTKPNESTETDYEISANLGEDMKNLFGIDIDDIELGLDRDMLPTSDDSAIAEIMLGTEEYDAPIYNSSREYYEAELCLRAQEERIKMMDAMHKGMILDVENRLEQAERERLANMLDGVNRANSELKHIDLQIERYTCELSAISDYRDLICAIECFARDAFREGTPAYSVSTETLVLFWSKLKITVWSPDSLMALEAIKTLGTVLSQYQSK